MKLGQVIRLGNDIDFYETLYILNDINFFETPCRLKKKSSIKEYLLFNTAA